jgi:membrane protein DedA with SNARE-associated domain
MEEMATYMTDLLRDYRQWAVLIIGLGAFAESLFLVGLVFPASPIFLAAGGLLATGALEPLPLIASAVAGAILGDMVSYVMGRKYGRQMIYRPFAKRHRQKIAKARLFFRKYGLLSVFAGRFIGPLRSTVPFVAGMTQMRLMRFQIANCLSAILWAPVMLMPGWMTVSGYQAI